MTNEQKRSLQMLEQGVPLIINSALQLESMLLQSRTLMSPQEWQEVIDTWRTQVQQSIADDPEINNHEVWERLQSYLLPMLRTVGASNPQ